MNKIDVVNFKELAKVSKKISNPFSRETFISIVKEEFGEGFTIFYDMGNGIALFVRKITPKKDLLLVEESEISGASLIYNLASNINFVFKDKQKYLLKKDNFLIGLSSNKFYVETLLQKDNPLITITIGLKKELFLEMANSIKNIKEFMDEAIDKSYYILQRKNIDSQQFELLDFFKELNLYEDVLNSIYLESKTTDLLHYTINKLSKILNNQTKSILDKRRISSLERAKEIIQKEYNTNLSIKKIANKSATNECYLKKDFKDYYGMTILEMLQKRRLEVAKQLLQKDLSVKEVALKVGYKHTGNFSKLFLNNFNISPYQYKKNST
ncbi:MAG: AraC family transcriptional regulator [Advenella sp.]